MKFAGNSKMVKKINVHNVLNCIRKNGTISKVHIKEMTKLTPTTISEITNSMIAEGLIIDAGVSKSTGGRPSQLLSINSDHAYFIGAEVDVNNLKIAIVGFDMKIKCKYSVDIKNCKSEEVISLLINNTLKIIEQSRIPKEKIKGIGIAVPGLVNKNEIIELAPNLRWVKVDIKSKIEEKLCIPVIVQNESKLSAVAEKYSGLAKDVNNFVAINIKSGVGAGIYINNHLYLGQSGNAGELGHTTVKEDGPLCGCGNYGCLETMASTPSIIKRAITCKKQGENSILFENKKNIEEIVLNDIITFCKKGDKLCNKILESAAKYVGISVSSLINLLNPKLIILGGDLILYKDIVIRRVTEIVETKSLSSNRDVCEIKMTELGEDNALLGAAIVSINKYLNIREDLDNIFSIYD